MGASDDHYATLGVTPGAEDSVIRAAYLALMRQYHPDRNAALAASERARSIIAAFAVVGDPERRLHYDWGRRRAAEAAARPVGWRPRLSQPLIAVLAIALLAATLVFAWPALRRAPADQANADAAMGLPDLRTAEEQCAAPATRDRLRRDLIARAAQLGGGGTDFERMAAGVTLEVGRPGFAKRDAVVRSVECTAPVTLSLPADRRFPGGQRVLVADLDYAIRLSTNGDDAMVLLSNGDLIARPLAAAAALGVSTAAPPPPAPDLSDFTPPPDLPAMPQAAPMSVKAPRAPSSPPPPRVDPSPPRVATARPARVAEARAAATPKRTPTPTDRPAAPARVAAPTSPDRCGTARAGAASTICRDPNLAALDRNATRFYDQSAALAKASRRAALAQARASFLVRREACRTDACLRSVHVGHMRDIAAIAEGRAQ